MKSYLCYAEGKSDPRVVLTFPMEGLDIVDVAMKAKQFAGEDFNVYSIVEFEKEDEADE